MSPLRPTNARRLRRNAYIVSATAVCASSLAFGIPTAGATPSFTAGNLLVSTSVFDDAPNITAGSTVLPLAATSFNISAITTSGSGPFTVTITTGTTKNKFIIGQTITVSGVGGATGVNGNQVVTGLPTTTSFTISLASSPGSYTSGGTVLGDIAIAGNQYPQVFNNAAVDANFGVTEPIVLDEIAPTTSLVTTPVSSVTVPNSDSSAPDQLVTSFPSKSEVALNESTNGNYVSFMGYNAPTAAVDVSNSNTPTEVDSTNTDTAPGTSGTGYFRDAATMDGSGNFQFTETGAYGGNNGRAVVLNEGNNTLLMTGNGGNGADPAFTGVVTGTGAQIATEATTSEAAQDATHPGTDPFGNFNIRQTGQAADKSTKDNNFRGLTLYNGVLYLSKGSGSNGINTVYFVDTTGQACPMPGSPTSTSANGVPQAGATVPSTSTWASSPEAPGYNTTSSALGLSSSNPGLSPTNMCILKGFPTTLAKASSGVTFPFGMWFANPTTLYVADEGSGAGGAGDNTGGLEKWVYNGTTWVLQYTLQTGLNLQSPYSVNPSPAGVNGGAGGQAYPTGNNTAPGGSGKAWTPATDGLRNVVGRANGDGTVTIWATTSTISGGGDQGADPNQVVAITDSLPATTLPGAETFSQVMAPTDGVVYRGVSFTPNTPVPNVLPEVPWVPLIPLSAVVIGGGFWIRSRRRMVPAR
jgi:hypothetical protein